MPAKHIFKECAIGMEKMLRELRERVLNNIDEAKASAELEQIRKMSR